MKPPRRERARVVVERRVRALSDEQCAWLGPEDRAEDYGIQVDGLEVEAELVDLWLLVDTPAGWRAAYRVVAREGRPVVAELRLFPLDDAPGLEAAQWSTELCGDRAVVPGDGLTSRVLKETAVPGRHVFELLPQAVKEALASGVQFDQVNVSALLGALGFNDATKAEPRRGRPPALLRYARLCADYVAACKAGSRSPVEAVARLHRIKLETARQMLHRSRAKYGLLTRQTAGLPGGELTPRCRALLRKKPALKRPGRS